MLKQILRLCLHCTAKEDLRYVERCQSDAYVYKVSCNHRAPQGGYHFLIVSWRRGIFASAEARSVFTEEQIKPGSYTMTVRSWAGEQEEAAKRIITLHKTFHISHQTELKPGWRTLYTAQNWCPYCIWKSWAGATSSFLKLSMQWE